MKRYQYEQGSLRENPLLYLSEIVLYIEKIETFTEGITREQFLKDELRNLCG
jgi:uncharacterized protein with HEPN domain